MRLMGKTSNIFVTKKNFFEKSHENVQNRNGNKIVTQKYKTKSGVSQPNK